MSCVRPFSLGRRYDGEGLQDAPRTQSIIHRACIIIMFGHRARWNRTYALDTESMKSGAKHTKLQQLQQAKLQQLDQERSKLLQQRDKLRNKLQKGAVQLEELKGVTAQWTKQIAADLSVVRAISASQLGAVDSLV